MKKDKSDFDDTKIFSDDLIELVENDKDERSTLLKKFVDGEPKNIDPLTEIPVLKRDYMVFQEHLKVHFLILKKN